ncbi:MAG: hypothetical protein R2757_11700 [Draconibacterium sp.]|jgi:hypothetical protein
MNILLVLLGAIVLLGLAFAGLAIQILVKKGGEFPNTHVSGNRYLKREGVYCSQTQDRLEQAKAWKKISYNNLTFTSDMKAGE